MGEVEDEGGGKFWDFSFFLFNFEITLLRFISHLIRRIDDNFKG